jgi:GAF domain/ANTAR domain
MALDSVSSPGVNYEARLCSALVDALSLSGGSITVFGHNGIQSTICASDTVAARCDALQFELGVGPRWEALTTGAPVLCPDLSDTPHPVWPMFSVAAMQLGVAAVFAFPVKIGAATVGVVDLYSSTPRRLDAHQVSLAESTASRMAAAVVHTATASANDPNSVEHPMAPALRREVHQATGMIQAQLDTTATDAFTRLRAHAFASGRPVEVIAREVVERHLDFSTITD